MTVEVHGLGHCSTCQKALSWLDEHGIEHVFSDYREHPLPATALKAYATQLGWEKLVNRASYTWRGLDEAQKSPANDADWLALIAEHPTLIRRPLLVQPDGRASAGFSAKRYAELFATND